MSGIVGVLWRNGRAAAAADLEPILTHLGHRGPPRIGCVRHAVLAELGASEDAVRPSGDGVAFDGRIDNRDELLRELGGSSDATDRELVAAAHTRWGDGFAARLLGDFALALWDERDRRLVCARDAFGLRPFHYHLDRDVFVFASELRAVLAHPSVSQTIDEGMAGEVLCVNVASTTATLFADVRRLAPGHVAHVSADRAGTRAWWRPPSASPDPRRPRDWSGLLRERLREAVASRTRGLDTVGTHLSGGWDSSAVTVLARSAAGVGQRVEAFANVYPGRSCDERPYLRAVAASAGVRVHEVEEPAFSAETFLASVEDTLDLPDYPAEVASRALRQAARDRGLGVLLTGYGGDETTYPNHDLGAEHLLAGRWHEALGGASSAWRRGGLPAGRAWARHALAASLPRGLRRALGGGGRRVALPPWIAPGWARSIDLQERMRVPACGLRSPAKGGMVEALGAGWAVHGHEMEERTAVRQGVDQRHPFLDRRVVELALVVPERIRVGPGGERRLLSSAVGAVLPPTVRARRSKAAFDYVFVEALRCLDAYHAWPSLRLAEAGWVDETVVRRLHAGYREQHQRSGCPGPQGFALWAILGLELWFRRVVGPERPSPQAG